MTKEEMTELPLGTFVFHKDYGYCLVFGHTFGFAVDIKLLDGDCLGRDEIAEARYWMMRKATDDEMAPIKAAWQAQFDEAMEKVFGKKEARIC